MKKIQKNIFPILACSTLLTPLISMVACSKQQTNSVINVNFANQYVDDSLTIAKPITLSAGKDITIKSDLSNLASFGRWDWWCIWFDNETGQEYPDLEVTIKTLKIHRYTLDPEKHRIEVTYNVMDDFDVDNAGDDGYKIIFRRNKNVDEQGFDKIDVTTDVIECTFSLSATLKDALIYVEKESLFNTNKMSTDFELEPQYGLSVSKQSEPEPALYTYYELKTDYIDDWKITKCESLWKESDSTYEEFVKIPSGYYYDSQKSLVTSEFYEKVDNEGEFAEFLIHLNYSPTFDYWYLPLTFSDDEFAFPFHITAEGPTINGNEQTHEEDVIFKLDNYTWDRSPLDLNRKYERALNLHESDDAKELVSSKDPTFSKKDDYGEVFAIWVRAADLRMTEADVQKNQDFTITLETDTEEGLQPKLDDFKVYIDYKEYSVRYNSEEPADFQIVKSDDNKNWTIQWIGQGGKAKPTWHNNSSFKIVGKLFDPSAESPADKYSLKAHFTVPIKP